MIFHFLFICNYVCSQANEKLGGSVEVGNVASFPESVFTFDDSTLYKITWLQSPDNNSNHDSKPKIEDHEEEMLISSINKENYRCVIPKISHLATLDSDGSKEIDPNPYELMKPAFSKKMCSYRVENYWTYEICHGKYIRQFHEDTRTRGTVQEYFLGRFKADDLNKYITHYEEHERGKKRPLISVEDLQLPYIEVNMTGGTMCDLSNKKRMTRVLYVCIEEGNHDLYSVKETSTCEYEVISFSPLLCESSEFKLKTPTEHEIKCYSLNGKSPSPVPKGYELDDIQTDIKTQKSMRFDSENIFEGKSNLLEPIGLDKILQIEILPDTDSLSSISLQFLKGEYCLTGGSGWWKYEFCYGKKVDQFHEEKNGKKVVINLGNWDLKEHIKWIEANPSKRPKMGKTPKQVSHFYSYGEACDLTKKPRTVEVKLKCPGTSTPMESVTIYLMEPRTCEYVLGVESAIICNLLSSIDENGLFKNPDLISSINDD